MLENNSIVLDCGSHSFRWSHLVIKARGECGKRILQKVVSMAVEGGLSGAMGGASGPSVCRRFGASRSSFPPRSRSSPSKISEWRWRCSVLALNSLGSPVVLALSVRSALLCEFEVLAL